MFCPRCGTGLPNDARFCERCGQPMQPQFNPPVAPPPPPALDAVGVNGQISIIGDRVRISRRGALARMGHGFKGDKEILISQITSIQFKSAGKVLNGYIQFAFVGGQETKGGILDATKDENTVMFSIKQQPAFEWIKNEIDRRHSAPAQPTIQPVVMRPPSVADEIERLAQLRDRGLITEDEFNIKKRQLLGL